MVGNHVCGGSLWLKMHRSVLKWLVAGLGDYAMEKRGVLEGELKAREAQ